MVIMRKETFVVLLGGKNPSFLFPPLPRSLQRSARAECHGGSGGHGADEGHPRAQARQRGARTPSAGLAGVLEGSFPCGHFGGSRKAREHENNCIYICEEFLAGFQRALQQNCLLYSEGFTDCPA